MTAHITIGENIATGNIGGSMSYKLTGKGLVRRPFVLPKKGKIRRVYSPCVSVGGLARRGKKYLHQLRYRRIRLRLYEQHHIQKKSSDIRNWSNIF